MIPTPYSKIKGKVTENTGPLLIVPSISYPNGKIKLKIRIIINLFPALPNFFFGIQEGAVLLFERQ